MDNNSPERAAAALARVTKMIEDGELTVFTKDEAESLKEVAQTWNQFKAVIALGSIVGSGFKWFIMIAAAWVTFKSGLFEWIKGGLR